MMTDFMLIMILVLLFGTQHCFNKTWNANMNEEQRKILKKFAKHMAKVVSKIFPLLLKEGDSVCFSKNDFETILCNPKTIKCYHIDFILYNTDYAFFNKIK